MSSSSPGRLYNSAYLLIFIVVGINIYFYFNFTAEDAYITYRYAENLINLGSLVYNEGEPINALTSPLHAIFSAALYYVTGDTVLSNKILGLLLLSVSALIVWRRFQNRRHLQFLALGLTLMPPSVLLWTFGGLETSILLFLVTLTVFLVDRTTQLSFLSLFAVFFVAGLAFLTRYDSALFFLPLLVYACSKARAPSHILLAFLGAAILPIAWFATSSYYYGDLLPTSFYVKTPSANIGSLFFNGIYISAYLIFVGIIPVLFVAFILLLWSHKPLSIVSRHFKRMWWLYLGILLELAYGLTMATHHMMFSFRFFLAYLPATVILVVDLIRHASETERSALSSPKAVALLVGFLFLLSFFQLYQSAYTYFNSLNGISPVGEYRALGARDYVKFIQILKQEALDIEAHWNSQEITNRKPRIITYAAGALPYVFRDSYIYEKLVSYRHCHQRYQQGRHADYIHIVAPRQGTIQEQLPNPENNYSLISSYDMFFDGSQQRFLVYFNPEPEDHNLGSTIDFACRTGQ